MQSYVGSSSESHNQPLDFTSKNRINESPILDLSCKKKLQDQLQHLHHDDHAGHGEQQHDEHQQQHSQSHVYSLSPVSVELRSVSPSCEPTSPNCDHPHQSRRTSYDEERKSPIEVRTFMVTPPSESDSPKKPKFTSMYPYLNTLATDMSPRYPRLTMNMSLPMSPVLSTLLTGDNMSQIHMQPMPASLPIVAPSPTSSHHDNSGSLTSPESSKKGPRPFKAYPKDPLSMSIGSAELIHDRTSNEAYNEFRKRMLESVRRTNEGTNIKMRRVSKSPTLPTSTMDDKDAAYWERRRKNNEAAKRSRDARRAKEDEIAIRAAFLEQENVQLKCELAALRNETAKLRCMMFTA